MPCHAMPCHALHNLKLVFGNFDRFNEGSGQFWVHFGQSNRFVARRAFAFALGLRLRRRRWGGGGWWQQVRGRGRSRRRVGARRGVELVFARRKQLCRVQLNGGSVRALDLLRPSAHSRAQPRTAHHTPRTTPHSQLTAQALRFALGLICFTHTLTIGWLGWSGAKSVRATARACR
jgi:hypothetical protein